MLARRPNLAHPRPHLETSSVCPSRGPRNQAVLLVEFVGTLRRYEISDLDLEHVANLANLANGLVLSLRRSKTDQRGTRDELVSRA